jgi:hypothetical protein
MDSKSIMFGLGKQRVPAASLAQSIFEASVTDDERDKHILAEAPKDVHELGADHFWLEYTCMRLFVAFAAAKQTLHQDVWNEFSENFLKCLTAYSDSLDIEKRCWQLGPRHLEFKDTVTERILLYARVSNQDGVDGVARTFSKLCETGHENHELQNIGRSLYQKRGAEIGATIKTFKVTKTTA